MMHEPLSYLDTDDLSQRSEWNHLIEAAHSWRDRHSMTIKVIFDEDFRILFVSESVQDVFGYQPSDLVNESILSYIHPENRQWVKQSIHSLPYDEKVVDEFRVLNSNGDYIDCQANSGKIINPVTDQPYNVTVIQDVMEHKQAQQMLISSEKLATAGQLAASIAHEIRNPITSLKGFLQLLETGIEGKEDYLKIMKDEIDKIEAISKEMLYISKPSPNQFEEDDIVSVLEDVCMLMRSQARMNDIDLVLESDMEAFDLYCDPQQLKQVFVNLIKNAIEAMEEPGSITIRVTNEDDLYVDVIDEGPGVPDSLKAKLGQPFFTTKDKGTGLGLMVTLDILESHRASLTIHDHEPQGSIFRLQFRQS
ncbi:PAS domain S-box-containing protein [Alkalibacillus flavidus]|uniref:histidine kinase n=1 Tax=Alkalibacillus flavidus TaxID=546021 RepID=A0ABV2KSW5_9BACI